MLERAWNYYNVVSFWQADERELYLGNSFWKGTLKKIVDFVFVTQCYDIIRLLLTKNWYCPCMGEGTREGWDQLQLACGSWKLYFIRSSRKPFRVLRHKEFVLTSKHNILLYVSCRYRGLVGVFFLNILRAFRENDRGKQLSYVSLSFSWKIIRHSPPLLLNIHNTISYTCAQIIRQTPVATLIFGHIPP